MIKRSKFAAVSFLAVLLAPVCTAAFAAMPERTETIYQVFIKGGQEYYADHGKLISLPGKGVETGTVSIVTGSSGRQWYIDRDGGKVLLTQEGTQVEQPSGWVEESASQSLPTTISTQATREIVVQQQPVLIEETDPVVQYVGVTPVVQGLNLGINVGGYRNWGYGSPYYYHHAYGSSAYIGTGYRRWYH